MTEQPKSFYDNVWGVISSKVGNNTDDWEDGWNAAMQYIKTTAKELEGTK